MSAASSEDSNSGCGMAITVIAVIVLALMALSFIWWLMFILAAVAAIGAFVFWKRASEQEPAEEKPDPSYTQQCTSCGAQIEVSVYDSIAKCEYCGSSFPAGHTPLIREEKQGQGGLLSDPFKALVALAVVFVILGVIGLGYSVFNGSTGSSSHSRASSSHTVVPNGSASSASSAFTSSTTFSEPVELNSLQKAFCSLNLEMTRDDVKTLIEENQFTLNEVGDGNTLFCIGYEYDAVTTRGRDREGEAMDVSFDDEGMVKSADYTVHTGYSTHVALEFKNGSFCYEGAKVKDAESAMRQYLAAIGYEAVADE